MVCSYSSSCLDLPVALVNFQVKVLPLSLYQVCQGYYVLLNDIDFEGGERNICPNCVGNIGRGGESQRN